MKIPTKTLLGAIVGAAGGFAYYYFVGCQSGTCPITSNPWISTLYGMAIGGLLFFPAKRKAEKTKN